MATAMREVCNAASRKGVKLLPAAEGSATNTGIHEWSLALQQIHNMSMKNRATKIGNPAKASAAATVYSTYQAYLKSTPQRLLHDLKIASHNGFTLGVKLVRGAYLASEPQRDLIWDTKQQTDKAYDMITRALLQAQTKDLCAMALHHPNYGREGVKAKEEEKTIFSSPNEIKKKSFPFPNVNLLLATHNRHSVLEAQRLQALKAHERKQGRGERATVEVAFAQLQGMADEISCGLVVDKMKNNAEIGDSLSVSDNSNSNNNKRTFIDAHCHHPQVYKCLAWGTVEQCLGYLLRRADENKEAAGRTADTARAMTRELWRRIKSGMRV